MVLYGVSYLCINLGINLEKPKRVFKFANEPTVLKTLKNTSHPRRITGTVMKQFEQSNSENAEDLPTVIRKI